MSIDVNQTSAVLTCYNCQEKGHMARCAFHSSLLVPFLQLSSQGLHGSEEGKGQLWACVLQLPGIRAHGQV